MADATQDRRDKRFAVIFIVVRAMAMCGLVVLLMLR